MAKQNPFMARRARYLACAMAFVTAMVLVPAARAQWKVQDTEAIKVLGTQSDGTISRNTKDMRDRLTLGTYDQNKPGARMGDPAVALDKPNAGTQLDDGSSCSGLNDKQQPICQQIIKIENAQYQYMLTVYDTSNVRDGVLRKLLEERQGLDENSYGKLEDNTNKLTALYNLIALDRQQMDAVNYAYQANITYLNKKMALLAKAAQTGKTQDSSGTGGSSLPGVGSTIDIGSLVSGVVTGAVLKEALNGVQSSRPSGMQTLAIEKENK